MGHKRRPCKRTNKSWRMRDTLANKRLMEKDAEEMAKEILDEVLDEVENVVAAGM